MILAVAHPFGQVELADVVQHRTDTDVEHVGLAEPEVRPSSSEISVTFIAWAAALSPAASVSNRMHSSFSPSILLTSVWAKACAFSRAIFGCATTRSVSWRHSRVASANCARTARARRVARRVLRGARAGRAGRPLRIVGGATGRFGSERRRAGFFGFAQLDAQLFQAQRADRGDLLRRGDAEAAERKRMRHPACVQMHEHPDAQRVDLDLCGGSGVFHLCERTHGAGGLRGLSAARPEA
jgi:hypothetical protein